MCSELEVAIKDPKGFHPTKSLLSMIEEDIEAMEAIYMMVRLFAPARHSYPELTSFAPPSGAITRANRKRRSVARADPTLYPRVRAPAGRLMPRAPADALLLGPFRIFPVPLDLMSETKRICSVFASEWCGRAASHLRLCLPANAALLTLLLTFGSRLKRIHLSLTHGPSLQSLHGMGFKRIQADSGRLAQILINLLSNAIRESLLQKLLCVVSS